MFGMWRGNREMKVVADIEIDLNTFYRLCKAYENATGGGPYNSKDLSYFIYRLITEFEDKEKNKK